MIDFHNDLGKMTFTITKVPEADKIKKLPYRDSETGIEYNSQGLPYIDFAYNIVFYEDFTFASFSHPPCGVACSPVSYGHYKIIDPKHIHLYINEMKQSGIGDCDNFTDQETKDLGVFSVEQAGKSLRLIKVSTKSLN